MPARKCPHCKAWTNFSVNNNRSAPSGDGDLLLGLDECQNCMKVSLFKRDQPGAQATLMYPKVESEPDEELPDDVKIPLREAYSSLGERSWNSCVTMARRALEEAASDLGASGSNLYEKIEDLANKQKITPDLKEWAHEGRLGGNLGAHGSPVKKWADEQDAKEVLEFTAWFMRYAYVLPAQLALRRSQIATSP